MSENVLKNTAWNEAIERICSYLSSKNGPSSFTQEMSLLNNGKLSFHWANWKDSCMFQRSEVSKNKVARERLFQLEQTINRFKKIPVWMSVREKIVENTMYDLYQAYLDPRIRANWFNREEEILISMTINSGSYLALSSMRWFDKETYRAFVYHKILTQRMCLRQFRLGVEIPVIAEFDESGISCSPMTITQISNAGVLLHLDGRQNFIRLINSKYIKLRFDQESWTQFSAQFPAEWCLITSSQDQGKFINSSMVNSEVLNWYDNMLNIKSSPAGDVFYFFVRYADLSPVEHCPSIQDLLYPFVKEAINCFNTGLKLAA